MIDAVVQLEGLHKEAIAQAAAQSDVEEVEIVSIGFLMDLPTDDAPLVTAANAVTRYRAACHYSVAADVCGAGQPKLSELHAVPILLWLARYPQQWVALRHRLCMLKVRCCLTHLVTDLGQGSPWTDRLVTCSGVCDLSNLLLQCIHHDF